MLERVFRMLPPRDLRTVVLVCRRWKEVAEKPFLWSWVSLAVDTTNLAHMPGLLRGRLLRVTEMRARVASEELLHAVASHPALRALDISDTPLPRIDADLLASSITGRLTKLVIIVQGELRPICSPTRYVIALLETEMGPRGPDLVGMLR